MTITGDLVELSNAYDVPSSSQETIEHEDLPWLINIDSRIPIEIFSLYFINSEIVQIDDVDNKIFDMIKNSTFSHITAHNVDNKIFDMIKNSTFSHITAHIHDSEEMFILFFEFAIEQNNKFEFVHFGLVPTNDFFDALKNKPVLKIRTKLFYLTEFALKRILDKLDTFNSKYGDKS